MPHQMKRGSCRVLREIKHMIPELFPLSDALRTVDRLILLKPGFEEGLFYAHPVEFQPDILPRIRLIGSVEVDLPVTSYYLYTTASTIVFPST